MAEGSSFQQTQITTDEMVDGVDAPGRRMADQKTGEAGNQESWLLKARKKSRGGSGHIRGALPETHCPRLGWMTPLSTPVGAFPVQLGNLPLSHPPHAHGQDGPACDACPPPSGNSENYIKNDFLRGGMVGCQVPAPILKVHKV